MRAAARWRRLVTARLAETEALAPGPGPGGRQFWDERARRFARRTAGTAETDPFLRRVRRAAGAGAHVVDIGAGPGRFSIALAPSVARVTAVDQSPVMLSLLRKEARRRGVRNVRTVSGRWEDVEVAPADVLICSYVLPLIADAAPFLAKMEQARRPDGGTAFVYINAMSGDALVDPLWRHFHGRPRRPAPTYLDAVEVLHGLGMEVGVEVVEVSSRVRFATLDEAVEQYRDLLLLGDDDDARTDLTGLLAAWLVGRPGRWRPPLPASPAAILRWPDHGRSRVRSPPPG